MPDEKLSYTLAFLLLVPCAFAQEPPQTPPQPAVVSENAQLQQQDDKTPSPPGANPLNFEGIVIQAMPLEVKSMSGEIRQFFTEEKGAGIVQPRIGDLIKLGYEHTPKGNILKGEAEVVGRTIVGTIKEIAADTSRLVVRTQQPDKPENEINIPLQIDNQFQPLVSAMRPGDGINAAFVRDGGVEAMDGINHVKFLEWQSKPVGRSARWFSLIGALISLWVIAFIFTKGRPTALFLGTDNRYSSSKFQTVLWFTLVISAYIAIVSHRIAAAGWTYVGGVDIPTNLLILSGISVLTFAAAKAITTGKIEGKPDMKTSAAAPKALDLITDDNDRTDLGDFQMVAITILAVIIYAISTVEFMEHIEFRRVVTMPDVDATMLSIFGLGQAAYLGKKAAGEG